MWQRDEQKHWRSEEFQGQVPRVRKGATLPEIIKKNVEKTRKITCKQTNLSTVYVLQSVTLFTVYLNCVFSKQLFRYFVK